MDEEESLWWKLDAIRLCVHKFLTKEEKDESYLIEALDTLNDIEATLQSLINKG